MNRSCKERLFCSFFNMLLYGLDNKRSAYEHDGGRDSEVDSSKRIEQAIYELGNEVKDFIVLSYSLMC